MSQFVLLTDPAFKSILKRQSHNVKKLTFIIIVSALSLALFAQELAHETIVVNVEVPVRVFKGSTFVDNLSIDDFQVYEDGKLQKIEAVYLIKKTSIKKKEEKKKFTPEVSRNFVLLFQINEYLPKVGDAIEYFFNKVILPGDNLTIITPMKTYNFKSKALEVLPKEEIIKQLKSKLKKDSRMGSLEYRSLLKDISAYMSAPSEETLPICRLLLSRLEELRYVDENKLMEFADFLKAKEGQKHVYLFYQKEVIPQLGPATFTQLMSMNQDKQHFLFQLLDLFSSYRRDITFNIDRIKQVFADSSITIHFLYITKLPTLYDDGRIPSAMKWREQSEDIYSAFSEMAKATGGLTDSSANAAAAFQRAIDASENYYLLYYAPSNYKRDGKFKIIKVKVKNKNYRITHRAGYFAN